MIWLDKIPSLIWFLGEILHRFRKEIFICGLVKYILLIQWYRIKSIIYLLVWYALLTFQRLKASLHIICCIFDIHIHIFSTSIDWRVENEKQHIFSFKSVISIQIKYIFIISLFLPFKKKYIHSNVIYNSTFVYEKKKDRYMGENRKSKRTLSLTEFVITVPYPWVNVDSNHNFGIDE